MTLSKTEDQGAAITYPEELEEQLSIQPPASSRHQWFLYLDYKSVASILYIAQCNEKELSNMGIPTMHR